MARTRSLCAAATLLLLLPLGLVACGGDDTGGDDTSSTTGGGTRTEAPAQVPEDLCTVVTAEDVAAVTGETGVVAEPSPTGCRYPGGDRAGSVYPVVSVQAVVEGAGEIEAARAGAESALDAEAEDISVDGAAGYLITGKMVDSTSTQAAVRSDGLIVTVTLSGDRADVAVELLELVVGRL